MRRLSWLLASAASIACVRMLGACYPGTDCDFGLCPGLPALDYSPEGGTDGQIVAPADCDLAKSPKDSPACIDESVGIFVSPEGDDGADGTKQAPVRNITKAVELAGARGRPRIYVCEGTYDSNVQLETSVAILGGLTCAWAPSEEARPKLAPAKGIALRVTKVEGPVQIEGLDIVGSADAAVPGDSAIAAFVSESSNVTFRNVNLTAGPGAAGAKGASRSNYAGATASKGGNASGATGGTGASCSCVDATTSKGGNGAAGNGADVGNGSAMPAVGTLNGGLSGPTCTVGQPGANGAANGTGAPGTASGVLAPNGWLPATRVEAAPNGNPAQGGGGGGAETSFDGAGGGGGCGGCGGAGGEPGTNGGSSFALLSFRSAVTIDGGAAVASAGGRGGDGGDGQTGQAGGDGGGASACKGGPGGHGAGGSGGGGGAGGHSVPVAFVGDAPRIAGAKLTPGPKADGGDGGKPGQGSGNPGAAGTPGPAGKAQETLAL